MAGPTTCLATLFFAQTLGGDEGWTENWYVQGTSIEDCLETAKQYVAGRVNILHISWYVEAVRVSDITVLGDSREFIYSPSVSRGLAGGTAEEGAVCIFYRMEAGSVRRRMFPARGIPDGQMNTDRSLAISAAYQNKVNAYTKWWTDNKGKLMIMQNARTNDTPANIAENVADTRSIVATYPAGATLPAKNDKMLVHNVSQDVAYGYNGIWFVDSVAGQVVTMKPKRKHYVLGVAAGARIAKLTPTPIQIDKVQPEMGGTRKTGRPFGSPRGRQSATRH